MDSGRAGGDGALIAGRSAGSTAAASLLRGQRVSALCWDQPASETLC